MECSIEGTKTIGSQGEADSLAAACPTFTGSVTLGNFIPYHGITFNGIKEITGSLTTQDWDSVTADSLERIGGTFENHDSYTVTMDFPKLSYVGGISFTESNAMRPGLQHILFPSLTTVNGDLTITGNHYLSEVNMPNLKSVNGLFHLAESFGVFGLDLDKLETASPGGLDFRGSFWNGIHLASIRSVHPTFKIVAYSTGNCSEWDALRADGGALATTEQYSCEGNCANIYSGECSGQRPTTSTSSADA
ncbi:cell wall protein Ecm33 [Botryosphaeria dothidea]